MEMKGQKLLKSRGIEPIKMKNILYCIRTKSTMLQILLRLQESDQCSSEIMTVL